MLALLAETVPARRKPAATMATLAQVVSRAPALKGARGEAEDLAPLLVKYLDA